MKKTFIILITLCNCFILTSQQKPFKIDESKYFLRIDLYRDFFKRDFTNKEIEQSIIMNNDTLIPISTRDYSLFNFSNKKHKNPKNYSTSFTSLKHFELKYKRLPTSEDIKILNIRNNDTLIQIPNDDNYVSVKYEIKDSTFLEVYKGIVYQKYQKNKSENKKAYMRYWKKHIKVYFSSDFDKKIKKDLKILFKNLTEKVDSLTIKTVNNIEKSNYIIYDLKDNTSYDYDIRISKNEDVGYYLNWNRKSQIIRGTLQLNYQKVTDESVIADRVKLYFIKSLGHFKNTKLLDCSSIFSTCYKGTLSELSQTDLEILKYHYSYGICMGVSLTAFEKLHKKVQSNLKKKPNSTPHFLHPK